METRELRGVRSFLPVAALGTGVFAAGAAWWVSHDADAAFVETPQYLVWVLLFAAQLAIWTGGYVVAALDLWRVWQRPRGISEDVFWALLVLLGFSLAIVPTYGFGREDLPFKGAFAGLPDGKEWPLQDHAGRLVVFTSFGIGLSLLCVLGLFVVRGRFIDLARKETATKSDLVAFVDLRARMLRFLAIVGIAIGVGTLAVGAMKQAMDAAATPASPRASHCADLRKAGALDLRALVYCQGAPKPKPAKTIDDQFIVLFGLYYSGLLMLAYAPVYVAFLAAGRNLVSRNLAATRRPGGFVDQHEARKKLEDALQLNVGAAATFKSGVVVFAPLFGALTSLLLGTK